MINDDGKRLLMHLISKYSEAENGRFVITHYNMVKNYENGLSNLINNGYIAMENSIDEAIVFTDDGINILRSQK